VRISLLNTLCLILGISAGQASADIVTVGDGSLADWDLTVADNNGSFTQLPTNLTNSLLFGTRTLPNGFTYSYALEDQDDNSDDNDLGPNGSGQKYDSEFLGLGYDGDNVVISIVTGQRSDSLVYHYSPGDIRVQTTLGVFGVEVGGGPGDRPYNSDMIEEGEVGSTYYLDTDATTKGVLNSDGQAYYTVMGLTADASQQAGSVWFNPGWIYDPLVNGFGDYAGQQPVQLVSTGGTLKGLADFAYSWNATVSKHAIIEVAIPKSYFMGATIESVQWSSSCGNDVLFLETPSSVPEPSSLALVALGGLTLCGFRRSRRPSVS
jgi:hypothetical protein